MNPARTTQNEDRQKPICTAECYNATTPHCNCSCGGKNHGVGVEEAARNTIYATARWLENAHATDVQQLEALAHTARALRQVAGQAFPDEEPLNDLTDD